MSKCTGLCPSAVFHPGSHKLHTLGASTSRRSASSEKGESDKFQELSEFFTVSKTIRPNSSMALDQAHEKFNDTIKSMYGGLLFMNRIHQWRLTNDQALELLVLWLTTGATIY